MTKLQLSENDIAQVIETVWATALGLTAEPAENSERTEISESAANAEFVENSENSAFAGHRAPDLHSSLRGSAQDWAACVRISGGWHGAIVLRCPPELARMAAVAMFGRDPQQVTSAEALDALGELINMAGGNLKALLPPPCYSSLPSLSDAGFHDEFYRHGEQIREVRMSCLGWNFRVSLIEGGIEAGHAPAHATEPASAELQSLAGNRREFTRVAVNLSMSLVAGNTTIRCGRVHDLSMNGIACECEQPLPVGTPCRVILFLGDADDRVQVEAEARVIRCDGRRSDARRSGDPSCVDFLLAVELSEVNLESFHHICALVLNNASDEAMAEAELRSHLGIKSKNH